MLFFAGLFAINCNSMCRAQHDAFCCAAGASLLSKTAAAVTSIFDPLRVENFLRTRTVIISCHCASNTGWHMCYHFRKDRSNIKLPLLHSCLFDSHVRLRGHIEKNVT